MEGNTSTVANEPAIPLTLNEKLQGIAGQILINNTDLSQILENIKKDITEYTTKNTGYEEKLKELNQQLITQQQETTENKNKMNDLEKSLQAERELKDQIEATLKQQTNDANKLIQQISDNLGITDSIIEDINKIYNKQGGKSAKRKKYKRNKLRKTQRKRHK